MLVWIKAILIFCSSFIFQGFLVGGIKFLIFFVIFIENFLAKCDKYIVQRWDIKHLNFFRVSNGFIVFSGLENPIKVLKITVLGHIVQVLLQYKVGATPGLGPHFREVNAARAVLPIKEVSVWISSLSLSLGNQRHYRLCANVLDHQHFTRWQIYAFLYQSNLIKK